MLGVAYCVNGAASIAARATAAIVNEHVEGVIARPRGVGDAPVQTAIPESQSGGVAMGWPGVNSPRLRKMMGLSEKIEL